MRRYESGSGGDDIVHNRRHTRVTLFCKAIRPRAVNCEGSARITEKGSGCPCTLWLTLERGSADLGLCRLLLLFRMQGCSLLDCLSKLSACNVAVC